MTPTKKNNLIYWIITGLFSAFMLFSSIPDVIQTKETVEFMSKLLGYPAYFTPFIGVAKILGIIAILIPGYPRIKEWAYAGLMYDLTGATYSVITVGGFTGSSLFMLLPLTLGILAYVFYRRKIAGTVAAGKM